MDSFSNEISLGSGSVRARVEQYTDQPLPRPQAGSLAEHPVRRGEGKRVGLEDSALPWRVQDCVNTSTSTGGIKLMPRGDTKAHPNSSQGHSFKVF